MAEKKKTKAVRKPDFNKSDLYHDIEDEKHKKMKNKYFFKELGKLEILSRLYFTLQLSI